ncbi:Panacea domain-containing protein [Listeria monocytogenes]|uniref:Panacea domain-containing protein n=1 Tax=Listeria monocytogenes TaxID=1639 RepID=UPI00190DFC2A|nr:type II toxin-antitoxin system antitoxin SocA domain-containing protein [Listeria monocytogenes]MBK3698576.1 SocA family protein [Listeria monocytogenes]
MYSAEVLADWFLSQESMTPKKLQKMLYYAYAWTLTLTNDKDNDLTNKLFEEQFEAWVHGPVIPEIYRMYSVYGYNNIPKIDNEIDIGNKDIENILNQVMTVYGKYDGNELESITHQEEPWISARSGYGPLDTCNEVIDDTIIYKTYIGRVS